MELVVCDRLVKKFRKKVVLKNVSFRLPRGLTLILGKNGGGKTTLVKILSTLLPFDSGSVSVCGFDVRDRKKVRRLISYLPQETMVEDVTTVKEMLVTQSKLFDVPISKAFDMAEKLGLSELGTFAGELSGGMKRRLCVSLSLIPEREIYILDEPFGGIDFGGRIRIREIIEEIIKDGRNVILVSHTITGLEELANHILILDRGKVTFSGSPEELRKMFPNTASVRINSHIRIQEIIRPNFVVTQTDCISIVGYRSDLERVVGEYGLKLEKPTVGEIYSFFVSTYGSGAFSQHREKLEPPPHS